jgi:hypothetical protein
MIPKIGRTELLGALVPHLSQIPDRAVEPAGSVASVPLHQDELGADEEMAAVSELSVVLGLWVYLEGPSQRRGDMNMEDDLPSGVESGDEEKAEVRDPALHLCFDVQEAVVSAELAAMVAAGLKTCPNSAAEG